MLSSLILCFLAQSIYIFVHFVPNLQLQSTGTANHPVVSLIGSSVIDWHFFTTNDKEIGIYLADA